jgi:hypothetical protein
MLRMLLADDAGLGIVKDRAAPMPGLEPLQLEIAAHNATPVRRSGTGHITAPHEQRFHVQKNWFHAAGLQQCVKVPDRDHMLDKRQQLRRVLNSSLAELAYPWRSVAASTEQQI